MPTYRLDILITGTDRASPRISGFGRALGRIGQIAAGILIAGAIRAITDQIAGLARTAFESIADIERMTVGMEGLIAREIARGQTIETVSTAIRTLTEAEILSLDKLRLEYFLLGEELAEAETHYGDMIGEFGEGSMEVLDASIAVRDLKNEVMGVGSEMEALAGMEGKLISFTTTSTEGAIGLADALSLAVGPAKQLLDWVVQQALRSPYGEEEVMQALRVAAGYGFVTQAFGENITESERLRLSQEQGVVTAQRLTLASLDLIAAIGEQPETLVRIMRALGQIRGHGKLLGMEIRQLVNAGVGLDLMAMSMGMTTDEFQRAQVEGKILADEFIPALVKMIEEGLGGSAERLSQTLSGLKENFGDLRRVLLRNFLGPLVYEIEPALLKFYNKMSSPENLAKVTKFGENLRDTVLGAVGWFQTLHGAIKRTQDFFNKPWEIVLAVTPEDWTTKDRRELVDSIVSIGDAFERLNEIDPPGENLGFEDPEGIFGGFLAGLGIVTTIGWIIRLGGIAIGTLGWLAAGLGIVGLAVGGLGALWFGNFLGIRDITKNAWENYIKPAFMGIKKWFEEDAVPAMKTFHDEWKEKVWDLWVDTKAYIDEDLIPALITVKDELGDRFAVAMSVFRKNWMTLMRPVLVEMHRRLAEEIIPDIKEFAFKLGTDVYNAAETASKPLRNILGTWQAQRTTLVEDVIPAIWEFVRVVGGSLVTSSETARKVVGAGLLGAFTRLSGWAEEHLLPILTKVAGKLLDIGTWVTGLVRRAWEEVLLPAITKVGNFLAFHVAPVLGAVVNLLGAISGVIWFFLMGALNGLIMMFTDLWGVLSPGLVITLGIIGGFLTKIGTVMWWIVSAIASRFINQFLAEVGAIASIAARALDWLADAINRVADAINKWTESNIPKLWEPGSIPPIAQGFLDTAMALETMEDAYQGSSIFKAGALSGISSPMFAGAGVGAAAPVSIVVEGDTNHIVVESEGVARYITHRLREQKLKKFSEYMGR